MNQKLVIISAVVGAVISIFFFLVASHAILLIGSRAPRPKITRHEFSFELVYEVHGEAVVIADRIVVEHAGRSWDAGAGHHNLWTSHLIGDTDLAVELFRNDEELIFIDLQRYLRPTFLMGDPLSTWGLSLDFPEIRRRNLTQEPVPSYRLILTQDELRDEYDILIISWTYTPPLEDNFR